MLQPSHFTRKRLFAQSEAAVGADQEAGNTAHNDATARVGGEVDQDQGLHRSAMLALEDHAGAKQPAFDPAHARSGLHVCAEDHNLSFACSCPAGAPTVKILSV